MGRVRVSQVAIRGIVCTVPGAPLTIHELGSDLEAAELNKVARTVGLEHLYRVQPTQTAGDLCVAAGRQLLGNLGWSPDSVDAMILVTQTPDYFLPATACVAHGSLGLSPHCMAFDVGMGCSGYVYGLLLASQFVSSGACRRILLLAGDTISRTLAPDDRSTSLLFGDAGSATALEFEPDAPAVSFVAGTDGTGIHNLMIPSGGFRCPVLSEDGSPSIPGRRPQLHMDGLAVFDFTLKRLPPLVEETLCLQQWSKDDVDYYVFHQANAFMLQALAKKLRIAPDRMPLNIAKYANTSMVSIPLLLVDDLRGQISGEQPTRLLLAGFGVGYSWAAMAFSASRISAELLRLAEEPACTTPSP